MATSIGLSSAATDARHSLSDIDDTVPTAQPSRVTARAVAGGARRLAADCYPPPVGRAKIFAKATGLRSVDGLRLRFRLEIGHRAARPLRHANRRRSVVPLVSMLGIRASLLSSPLASSASPMTALLAAVLVAAGALSSVSECFAQAAEPAVAPSSVKARDPAAAEALFRSGRQLLQEARLEEAYSKFEESYRLDPTAGALFNQGECRMKQGKTASAWALYQQAATLADVQGKPDLFELAGTRATQLQTDLSYLTFHVAKPVPGLEVLRDGVLVGRAQFDVSLPIDPGRHSISVRAPGYEGLELAVVVGEKHDRQTINIPTLKEKALPIPPPQRRVVTPQAPASEPGPWPWVVGAAGATSLVVGSISGILAIRENHRMNDACPDRLNCSRDVLQAQGRRDLETNIAWIGIPVGLVALGGAATWMYYSQRADKPAQAGHKTFTIDTVATSHDFRLNLAGAF